MKFSCEKALLQAAISTTSRAVSPKSSIPALEGILLEAGSDLRLTGYNLETGIRTIVPADIREEGTLVLGARLFGEIVRKLPDDIVTFQSENYMVNIKCGMSEFNILGTDPEEFPELPTSNREPVWMGRLSLSLTAKRVWLIMAFSLDCGRIREFWYSTVGSSGNSSGSVPRMLNSLIPHLMLTI